VSGEDCQLCGREKKKAKSAAMQESAKALSQDAAVIQALRVKNMVLQVLSQQPSSRVGGRVNGCSKVSRAALAQTLLRSAGMLTAGSVCSNTLLTIHAGDVWSKEPLQTPCSTLCALTTCRLLLVAGQEPVAADVPGADRAPPGRGPACSSRRLRRRAGRCGCALAGPQRRRGSDSAVRGGAHGRSQGGVRGQGMHA